MASLLLRGGAFEAASGDAASVVGMVFFSVEGELNVDVDASLQ